MKKKPIKPKITRLKHALDIVFSRYIRARDKKCVTCGATTNLQAGHYMSRVYLATRHSEDNVFAQCVGCNVFKNGNMPAYTAFLEEKFGFGIVQHLQSRARKIIKLTPQWYEA